MIFPRAPSCSPTIIRVQYTHRDRECISRVTFEGLDLLMPGPTTEVLLEPASYDCMDCGCFRNSLMDRWSMLLVVCNDPTSRALRVVPRVECRSPVPPSCVGVLVEPQSHLSNPRQAFKSSTSKGRASVPNRATSRMSLTRRHPLTRCNASIAAL